MKMPAFAGLIKINPARVALPKPPKKYNSSKGKSLTDEDFLKLWNHVAKLAEDETNRIAARDYAILTLFAVKQSIEKRSVFKRLGVTTKVYELKIPYYR